MARRRWTRSAEPELLTPAQFLAMGAQPDGTVVRVLADAARGTIWRFRFRAGSPNVEKWESDGCEQLQAVGGGAVSQGTVGTTTLGDMTNTPALVAPLSGRYAGKAFGNVGAGAALSDSRVWITTSGGPASSIAAMVTQAAGEYAMLHADGEIALAAGSTYILRIATNNVVMAWGNPVGWQIILRPLRVAGP